jgi:hypothetical protein
MGHRILKKVIGSKFKVKPTNRQFAARNPIELLAQVWKAGKNVIPEKRSAIRNPGFSNSSGFRRLHRIPIRGSPE